MIPEDLKQRAAGEAARAGHAANGKNHQRPPLLERCAYPWHNLLIDTDGEARPCCWADVSWGNLNRLTLEEIWNGPRAMGMRQAFLKNIIPRACQRRHCRVDL